MGVVIAGGTELVEGLVVGGTKTGATGVVTASEPTGAKGFILPSSPEGVSKILESCKLIKAVSEKMASFNFILLTLNNIERRFLAIKEFWSVVFVSVDVAVFVVVGVEEETKFCCAGDGLIKKM
ncbi:MAG: hypothetical protein NT161_00755 [Candidatus Nomurabacteria bacterium]|nr:hypothetical protein [Candidatus Nomurabacteria bacterium]